MNSLRLNLLMMTATIILFLGALALNELLFARLEFVRGVNWIYLPAGIRLLCTLLFGEAGAIGLLLVSWAVCFFYFFPDDVIRSFMGGILASAAPYLVYRIMQRHAGMAPTLKNLTPARLLWCAVAFANSASTHRSPLRSSRSPASARMSSNGRSSVPPT